MNSSTPMMFRKQQIEKFCTDMQEAISFTGPNNEIHEDEFISAVIEEVQNRESNLTEARVAIEKYIVSSLAKDPEDVLMMQIREKAMPVIKDVIDIEIAMHGKPLYIVSADNNNGQAYSLSNVAANPINTIALPQDVAQEVAKYNFINITDTQQVIDLPEEEDINDHRVSFFEPLDEDTKEEQWLKDFEQEKFYSIIDYMLESINRFEQVSLFISDAVKQAIKANKTANQIKYEKDCFVPDPEVQSTKFIISARNSSLRYFFSALQFSSDSQGEFFNFVKDNQDKNKQLIEIKDKSVSQSDLALNCYNKVIDALINLSSKYPLTDEDFKYLCLFLDFSIPELRDHFYLALNDTAAYYEERKFFASSANCYLLKEYMASNYKIKTIEQDSHKNNSAFINNILTDILDNKTLNETTKDYLFSYICADKSDKVQAYETKLIELDRTNTTTSGKVINKDNYRVLALFDLLNISFYKKQEFFNFIIGEDTEQSNINMQKIFYSTLVSSLVNMVAGNTVSHDLTKYFTKLCDFLTKEERDFHYKAFISAQKEYEQRNETNKSKLFDNLLQHMQENFNYKKENIYNSSEADDASIGVFFG